MHRRLFLIAFVLVVGCDEPTNAPTPAPSATTATSSTSSTKTRTPPAAPTFSGPKLDPLPPLTRSITPGEVSQGTGETGAGAVTLETRMLTPTVTANDEVQIQVTFGGGDPKVKVDWAHTFSHLVAVVKGPDGKETKLVAKGDAALKHGVTTMQALEPRILRLSPSGVRERRHKWHVDWETKVPLFADAGAYTISLSGELAIAEAPVSFTSGEMSMTVDASANRLPLAGAEAAAATFLAKQMNGKQPPRPVLAVVEDEAGHRVVRFVVSTGGGGHDDLFIEVVVAPDGKVVSFASKKFFRCVVEGTPIATPAGPRAIETLGVGDEVIGFDTETRDTVVTTVTAVWPCYAQDLIALTDDLTVSSRHPIWSDGRWTEARDVSAGSTLVHRETGAIAASPRPLSGGQPVYDLSVAWPHDYFAAGVLVHNKATESKEAHRVRRDLDYRPTSK